MADPKYANLPGIDHNQPDVFETSELPEDDQAQRRQEEFENDEVERTKLDADDAFSKFKDKNLDATDVDFSERLSRKKKTGYAAPTLGEYEIVGSDEARKNETPQQKYQRIQHEIRELSEQVNQVQESLKADSSAESSSSVPMTKQIEYLQHQLTDLNLDKVLGTQGDMSLTNPQGALQKRLMTELLAFKEGGGKPTSDSTATSTEGSSATYQIYYRPEQAKFSNSARMSSLEERIERLEAAVGNNPDRLSSLTAETNNKSLMGAVALLTAKLKVLDPSQLEQVEGRISGLSGKLNQMTEKKQQLEENDSNSKISELYALVKKWDAMRDCIPSVADRLASLKILHEQALQFSSSLTHLETTQQQISTHLVDHKDMLQQVDKTLSENMACIQKNFENLDTRINALQK